MTELDESQKRYKTLFENHVDLKTGEVFDREFERDISKLRSLGESMKNKTGTKGWAKYPALVRFIWKHKLPPTMYEFIYQYALDGTIDFEKITSGMLIVSEKDELAVGEGIDEKEGYSKYRQSAGKRKMPTKTN